jgi:acid phosphatase type 7
VIAAAGDICSTTTDCGPTATLLGQIAPTRVLTLGDNAYPDGASSDYTSYYDPNWGKFKSITSPAPGNHDYHTANAAGYFGYFGSQAPAAYYSFDVGSWHLISLNGEIDHSAGSAQETWLANDLAAHKTQCTLAYWHEPRFSSGAVHGSDTGFDPFWRDLYAAGADVVLNGHDHDYERFAPQNPDGGADANGIREFVVGTGGASHYTFGAPIANSQVRDDTSYGVLKLTLHSSSYDWQFLPVAGASFTDSGSTACH